MAYDIIVELVRGTLEQQTLSLHWMRGFVRNCFPEEQKIQVRAEPIVDRRLRPGHLCFRENEEDELVSMAARTRETQNTTSISLVYTPP